MLTGPFRNYCGATHGRLWEGAIVLHVLAVSMLGWFLFTHPSVMGKAATLQWPSEGEKQEAFSPPTAAKAWRNTLTRVHYLRGTVIDTHPAIAGLLLRFAYFIVSPYPSLPVLAH